MKIDLDFPFWKRIVGRKKSCFLDYFYGSCWIFRHYRNFMLKNWYFWPVMVKIGSKLFKKTHFPTKFDEIFQMVPILICFEENNFWLYFWVRVPPVAKYRQNFFSSKHINMGTICKISSNRVEICVLLKYFDPILTNTSQKYEFLGIKLR